eukprot:192875-Chlamydomonas_euryale.AAC.1
MAGDARGALAAGGGRVNQQMEGRGAMYAGEVGQFKAAHGGTRGRGGSKEPTLLDQRSMLRGGRPRKGGR